MSGNKFKVDFFCVGVAKAGTTTLHDLLNLQSGISLPRKKETNYFSFGIQGKPAFTGPLDSSSVNETTVTSLEDYVNEFDSRQGCLIGEVCPSYALDGSAANIHEHNAEAKIIILLRDPINRAYSNYQHLVRDGREHGSFEDALAAENDRIAQGWEWFWGLKRNSLYFDFVREYVDTFGKENVMVIFFEDFVKDQEQHVKMVMEFIGLSPAITAHKEFNSNKSGIVSGKWKFLHRLFLSEGVLNSALRIILPPTVRKRLGFLLKSFSTVKGSVPTETRNRLSDEFSDDLNQLNELLGVRDEGWLGQRNVS